MRLRRQRSVRSALPAALLAASLLALADPAVAAPGGTLRDFRLPPDPEASSDQPRPQGPVAPDVPASRDVLRPETQPQPAAPQTPPVAPAPVPSPATTAAPRIVVPPPAPRAAAPAATPSPSPTATESRSAPPPVDAATPDLSEPAEQAPVPAAAPTPSPLPSAAPASPPSAPVEEDRLPLPWIIGGLLALAALAFGAWRWRKRGASPTAAAIPQIERPKPVPPAAAGAAPAPQPAASKEPLQIELEPLRFSLTLMNATLSYRLLLNNRGQQPLSGLQISADMIGAHASRAREDQLCGPDAGAMQVASIERLEPGESRIVTGEFRLPLSQVVPIRQGSAALLLPLARFRLESAEGEPVIRTFLVAQPPEQPGAKLQPFRLDLGPRIYPRLAQRAFA